MPPSCDAQLDHLKAEITESLHELGKVVHVLRRGEYIRETVKYYFADFVRNWGPPPPFTDFFPAKKELRIWGVPPPLYGFSPENLSSKRA